MNVTPTRALLVVNLLALLGLSWLWLDEEGHIRNINWVAPTTVKAVVASTSLSEAVNRGIDPAQLVSTLERPIFAPDRRPPPPVLPPPPPPPPDPLANVHLLGLIAGESGGALIRTEGKVRQVKLKGNLGDWTLQTTDDRSATFTRTTETRVIPLTYAPLNTAPSVAAPPSGRPASGGRPIEDILRQDTEQEERQRRVDAMRAQMNQKKP